MKPRLFLTGPSGIGKSTMISRELGERIRRAGGFLTVRDRNEEGRVIGFDIYSADGYGPRDRFLDMTGERPRMDLEVFSGVGLDYLRRAGERPFAVLDEIGGVELINDRFMDELARRALYDHLADDPNTMLLEVTDREDEKALTAVREWAEEYAQ